MAIGFPLILAGSVLGARRRSRPAVPEGVVCETRGQSMRTVPDAVLNTAATRPVPSSDGAIQSIGTLARPGSRRAGQAPIARGDVVDAYHPGEPATAVVRTVANGAAERGALDGGMLECLNHLDIAAAGEREDEVAS